MVLSSRVVLDSNILISALIHPGRAREFIFKLLYQDVEIVISDYIVNEVEEVLKRNKFKDRKILSSLWQFLKRDAIVVKVSFKPLKTYLRDPKDHPILKTGQKSKAQFIITGDDDLLSLKAWQNIRIINMHEFRKLLDTI